MLALDFKLTSGQVRELLFIWHGASMHDNDAWTSYPALQTMGHSVMHYQIAEKLEQKGLVVRRPGGTQLMGRNDPPDKGSMRWSCTSTGAAIAETIVQQAHIVMMIAASRKERLQKHNLDDSPYRSESVTP